MGFAGLFVVNPVGRIGGLALLWKEDIALEIYNYSCRHINDIIKYGVGNFIWKFTGFYRYPESAKREESWILLKHLKDHAPTPWLCVGNFNEILDHSEKKGVVVRRESQMDGSCTALEDCHLGDLGYTGSRFTWNNRRSDATFTNEQLDHVVANSEWCTRFPVVTVMILAARTSDHNQVYMQFSEQPMERHTDEECKEIIKVAWENDILRGMSMQDVQCRLSACHQDLSRWSWRKFVNVKEQLKIKTKQLVVLRRRECPALATAISTLQAEIDGHSGTGGYQVEAAGKIALVSS